MQDLHDRLMVVDRPAILLMLSELIQALTIRSRYFYDASDALTGLQETNEAIHRVCGHLRDLIDPVEPMTVSRADGICEASELLPLTQVARICGAKSKT